MKEYIKIPKSPPNKPGMAFILGTLEAFGLMGLSQLLQFNSLNLVNIQAELIGWTAPQCGQEKGGASSDINRLVEKIPFYPILILNSAILFRLEKS